MNIKQETIQKFRNEVKELINQSKFKEALDIASRYPLKINENDGFVITKTRLLNQYNIKESDLDSLSSVEKNNPYYKTSAKMILYLEAEVSTKFRPKTLA